MKETKSILKVNEVADILRLGIEDVKDLINCGDLRTVGSGKSLIRLCDLNSFLGTEPANTPMDAGIAEALPSSKKIKEVAAMPAKNKKAKPYWVESRKCFQMAPYLDTPTGKIRKIVSGKTEQEVLAKVKALKASLSAPASTVYSPVSSTIRYTINCLADEWWEHIQKKVTRTTLESYQYPYKEIKLFMGEKYADEISFRDIEAYYRWKEAQRAEVYSESTYSIRAKVLYNMFQYAERCKYIPRGTNPMLDKPLMPQSKPTDRDARFRSVDVLHDLLNVFQRHMRYTTILKFLLTTGMRISELCALKWSDISTRVSEPDHKICYAIHVQRALVKNPDYIPYDVNHRRYIEGPTKTQNGNRVIIVEQPVYDILLAWKKHVGKNQKLIEKIEANQTQDYIFVNDHGDTINPNTLRSKMKEYLERKLSEEENQEKVFIQEVEGNQENEHFQALKEDKNNKKVRFHDMRHTFASLMLEDEVDIAVISRMLGHSSIAITANIYTTITEKLKIKSAEKISSIVEKIG